MRHFHLSIKLYQTYQFFCYPSTFTSWVTKVAESDKFSGQLSVLSVGEMRRNLPADYEKVFL